MSMKTTKYKLSDMAKDSCKDTDDSDNNYELYKGETFSVRFLHRKSLHNKLNKFVYKSAASRFKQLLSNN